MAIEFIHGSHDAVLEFLFGRDADVTQHRAGELGEEALDEIEPGTMLGCEGEFEAADRLFGEPRGCPEQLAEGRAQGAWTGVRHRPPRRYVQSRARRAAELRRST